MHLLGGESHSTSISLSVTHILTFFNPLSTHLTFFYLQIFCEEETRSTSPINSAPLFSGIKKPLTPPEEEDSYGPSFRQFLGRKPTLYQEVSSSTGFHSESASEIGSGTDVPLCSAAIEEAYSESEEGNLEEDSREEGYSDSDEPGVKQMEEEEEEEALPLAVLSSKGFAFSYEEEADIRRVEKGIHPELEDDSEDLEDTWREDRDLVASSSNGRFSQLSPYDLHLQPFKAKTVDHFFEDRRVDGRASSSLQRDPQSTRGNRYGLDSDMDDSDSNVSGDQEPHLEVQGEQDEHHEIKERDSSPNGRLFGTRGFGRASESGVEIKRESSNSRDFENYANSRDFENYDHQGGEVNQEEKGTSNESAQSIGGRAQRIEDFESSSEGASSPQQFGIKDAATIGAEVKTNTQACPVPKGYPVPQQNNRSSLSPVVTSSPHAPARVLPSIQKSTNVSKLSPYGDVARSHVLTSIPRGSAMACTSTFTSTSSVNLNKRSNLFNPLRNKSSKRKMLRKMILQPRQGRSGKSVRTGLQIKGTASRVRKEKKDDQLDPDSHAESTPRGKVAVFSPSPSPPPGAAEEDQSLTVNSESQGPSQPEAEAEAEDVHVNYDTMDLSGSEPMEPISAQRNTVGFTFKEAESRQEEAEKEVDASAPIVQSSNGFEFADEEFLDQTDEFMDGAPDNWEDRGEYEEDAPQEDDWDGMGENGESQGTPDSDASSAKTGFESPSNLGALYPAMRINRPSRPNVQSSNAAASSQAVRKSLARVSGRNVSMSQVDDAIQKTIQNLEATRPSKEIETSTGLKRSCEAALGSSIITSAKRQRSEVSPPTDSIRARRGYLHGIAVGVGYTLGVASVAFG